MQKKPSTRWNTAHALLIMACLAVALAEVAFIVRVVRQRGVFDYVGLDYRGSRAAGVFLATSTLFLLAAFTLTVGHAHNLLGTTLLAGLVSISAFCGLGLRPVSKILL